MLKNIIVMSSIGLTFALATKPASANWAFGRESGGSAYAYEWYEDAEVLAFDLETRDGTLPDGIPYVNFKGTDASPQGHCLEVSFSAYMFSPDWMQIKVNDHGTYRVVSNANLINGNYSAIRLWLKNTGPSLDWALYLTGPDTDTGFSGDMLMAVKRLDVNKTNCINAAAPTMPWVSFEGQTSSYTITKGGF